MRKIPLDKLIKWEHNPKTQSKKQYEEMVEKYRTFGQLTEFAVMPDNVILGGNHGIDALKEIGVTEASCRDVDFVQEGEDWFFINEGEVLRHISFKSKMEGMLKMSVAHNARFSQYSGDLVANMMGNYNIDLSDDIMDLTPPKTLKEFLEMEEKEESNKQTDKPIDSEIIKCPSCNHEFKYTSIKL